MVRTDTKKRWRRTQTSRGRVFPPDPCAAARRRWCRAGNSREVDLARRRFLTRRRLEFDLLLTGQRQEIEETLGLLGQPLVFVVGHQDIRRPPAFRDDD